MGVGPERFSNSRAVWAERKCEQCEEVTLHKIHVQFPELAFVINRMS